MGREVRSNAKFKTKMLKVLCETGEMSYRAVGILQGGKSVKPRALKSMEENGWIRRDRIKVVKNYKSGQKKETKRRIVLTEITEHCNEWRKLVPYIEENEIKEIVKRTYTANAGNHTRALLQSEVVAMFVDSNVEIAPPPIEALAQIVEENYLYYNSWRIKENIQIENVGEGDYPIVRGTRALGVVTHTTSNL